MPGSLPYQLRFCGEKIEKRHECLATEVNAVQGRMEGAEEKVMKDVCTGMVKVRVRDECVVIGKTME
ncbi:unnamed protein product [Enterobius vermicularis]|uniref:Reverse transcriptase domain-containing protein n=1 Tax=Enterobius vermicularis TaxID=51028 RepID=A0A0N4VEY7_ENTVE|nr:unnamed protein product [Enterobius vermicularis]